MATTITNAAALSALIDFAANNGCEDSAALLKMRAHLASLEKAAKRGSGPTKRQIENDRLIDELAAHLLSTDEAITVATCAEYLTNTLGEDVSTQRATALLTRGAKLGKLDRFTDGKRVFFRAADEII